MAKTPPTERQLEVLQWIADGSPNGVMTDTTYKVAAYALERRSLARIKRRRPWDAEITEAGRRILAGADFEQVSTDTSIPTEPTRNISLPKSTNSDQKRSEPKQSAAAARPAVKGATEKMMDQLEVEHIIEFKSSERGRYTQLVNVVRRKKLLPDNMELVVSPRWSNPCTVELKRRPEWQLVTLVPVDIPATLRAPHAVVTKLKDQHTDRLGMDTPRWNWTLRVIQGLVVEAEIRGHEVSVIPVPRTDYYGRSVDEKNKGHLKIAIGEDEVQLHFSQSKDTVSRTLSAAELRRQANGYRVPTLESVKTDHIAVKLFGLEPEFWQAEWVETDTSRADDFLPRILQEIELRAARAVEQRLKKQQHDDEERRQWELVRDQAIAQLNEKHRAEVLYDQAERFQRAELLADYIDAMKIKARSMNAFQASAANEWIHWAESHMLATNPLRGELHMPADPKPDAEAIKPYMQGRSPYGPGRGIFG